MDAAGRQKALGKWGGNNDNFQLGICLQELLVAQAKRTPQACAVLCGDRRLSYRELDRKSNQLARRLQQLGVEPDTSVAICLEPSIELLVAVIAALKAGSSYTPISPSTPRMRLSFLLKDAEASVLITRERYVSNAPLPACHVVLVDAHAATIRHQRSERIGGDAVSDNLAYVIYTSGSTGKPRGVMVSHRGICNTLQWRQAVFPFLPTDRVLLTLSFTFDASAFQLFQTLLAGACLVIPEREYGGDPARIIDAVRRHRITVLGATASLWRLLLDQPDLEQCKSLRLAFCGGEPLPVDVPEKIWVRLGIPLHNMYGPTEASMEATCWTYVPDSPVSIGRPIANMRAYVLDGRLEPSPDGVAGELYLAGAGLARGYLNDPALTAERFLPDPFDSPAGTRMYRTGDVCRWLPTGCLEYLGRCDRQVKIRGHRIELDEIEAVLQGSAAVRENAVVLREDQPGHACIVAYVVPAKAGDDVRHLRRYLRARLPIYMIPAVFVPLGGLPRTTTGKIDRRALPPAGRAPAGRPRHRRVRPPLERLLASLWERILGVHGISDHDDFFELGGNSIDVAVVTRKLEEVLGEFVYTVALYDAPTISKLARYLRLNYAQSVRRLWGATALDGVPFGPRAVVDHASVAVLRSQVRTLTERVDGENEQKNRPAVFIFSAPRSGSTLLRVMLGGHPTLFAPPELLLLNFNTLRERKAALASRRNRFWLDGTIRAIMELRNCTAAEAARIMSDCERRDMSVKQFYGFMQRELGDATLVDKTPVYALDLQTLKRAEQDFEGARYIHLIRHPSSVIASFEEAKLHVFFPAFLPGSHKFTTVQLAELVWTVCQENIRDFLRAIPTDRKHVVRFEDLVRNPRQVMEDAARFLGINFHPDLVNPYAQDPRQQMTDALHPLARMLGDVKFHQHRGIRAQAAERKQGRYPEHALGEVTRELARSLGYDLRDRRRAALVALETRGRALPLFCVHAANGTVSCYHGLRRCLGSDQPLYAFRSTGLDEAASLPRSVRKLASSYVRELREVQPDGPYQLGGWSFGGLIAFEMALQLAASGQEIAVVALFSSYLPDTRIAHPPLRMRDFAPELVREPEADSRPAVLNVDTLNGHTSNVVSEISASDIRRSRLEHWRVYRANVRIGRRYVPSARLKRVILFEAEDGSADRTGLCIDWAAAATEVARHTVPGDHFTMMREPNVGELARSLKPYLRHHE